MHSFATKSLFVAKLHLCFEFQASGRKIFGFKSLQTNQWPDQEAWRSQGVIAYKEAKDASGARHVMLTFRTRLTRCSVQKRLAFLHVRFEAMETYGYGIHNAPHNSPIVKAIQDNVLVQWPAKRARHAVQQLHQLMRKAHKLLRDCLKKRSASEDQEEALKEFEQITSEWKALGGEESQDEESDGGLW